MADGHLFNNISLGGRGGTNPGQLRVNSGGIVWKKQGGGKAVEVDKAEIAGLTWMKVPRTNQLGILTRDGLKYKFTGFRDQDVSSLTSFFQTACGITPEEKQLSVSGKNWGEVELNASQNEDDDAVDPHLERIKNEAGGDESDEEDEDFVLDKDDGGSPTDDSGEEESDSSDSGGEKEKPAKKESKKEPSASSKASANRKRTKGGDEDSSKKKKPKKEKDPNAPKKPLSAFMFFSKTERENVKKSNPGISFTDVGRVLGERWNKMSAEEKEAFGVNAREDKKRYTDEMKGYNNPQPTNIGSGNESDTD